MKKDFEKLFFRIMGIIPTTTITTPVTTITFIGISRDWVWIYVCSKQKQKWWIKWLVKTIKYKY